MMKTSFQFDVICKIRKIRESFNLSQAKLGAIVGLSPGSIGNIESPKYSQKYTLAQIEIISKYFEISIEKLFFTDEDYFSDKDIISLLVSKIVEYEQ